MLSSRTGGRPIQVIVIAGLTVRDLPMPEPTMPECGCAKIT